MANPTDNHVSSRFIDADNEPTKTLLPIEGYEKYPLVSIEEAIKPVK